MRVVSLPRVHYIKKSCFHTTFKSHSLTSVTSKLAILLTALAISSTHVVIKSTKGYVVGFCKRATVMRNGMYKIAFIVSY